MSQIVSRWKIHNKISQVAQAQTIKEQFFSKIILLFKIKM